MKISIITVCLNSEKTIEKTIQSVLEQEYEELEYIIVDGMSTDETLKIVDKYKDRISKVISEQDEGLYDAMNKGLAMVSGDLIGIINSDDWYEPGLFNEVAECFSKTNADVIYGNLNLYDDNDFVSEWKMGGLEDIRYKITVSHPATFVANKAYKAFGGYDTQYKIAADYELFLRLYINNVKFSYLNRVFTNFRKGGVSQKKARLGHDEMFRISKHYLKYIPAEQLGCYKDRLLKHHKAVRFSDMLFRYSKLCCYEFNRDILDTRNGKLLIWGAGKWGAQMCKLLLEENVSPAFIIDNNCKQWGRTICGVEIVSPEKIVDFKGMVLIMVRNNSQDIAEQIMNLSNNGVKIVRWEDLLKKEII